MWRVCSFDLFLIIFVYLCALCPPTAHAALLCTEEGKDAGQLWEIVKNHNSILEHPSVQTVAFITSVQGCSDCAVLAINNAIMQVRAVDTAIMCVVVVVAAEIREVWTLQDRFVTPYVFADTSILLPEAVVQGDLPAMVLVDSAGRAVYVQSALQQHPLDDSQMRAWLLALKVRGGEQSSALFISRYWEMKKKRMDRTLHRRVGGGEILEEPYNRSVGKLTSGVIQYSRDRMYAVNTLAHCIEQWVLSSGQLLPPIIVPDSIAYFFCPDASDPLWTMMRERKRDRASIDGLYVVDDTLYVLLTVLSSYTYERVASVSGDTATQVAWYSGQLVWKICDDGNFVVPLPSRYGIRSFIADRSGRVGGTCVAFSTDGGQVSNNPAAFFVMIDIAHILHNKSTPCEIQVWHGQSHRTEQPGNAAAAPNGALWYCHPEQQQLVALLPVGSTTTIACRQTLRLCAAPNDSVPLYTSSNRAKYNVQGMVAVENTLTLLLSPVHISSALPPVLQTYTSAGEFLGEQVLAIPAASAAPLLQLLAIEDGNAFVLQHTPDKRWRVVRVPIAPPVHTHAVPVSHDVQKTTPAR